MTEGDYDRVKYPEFEDEQVEQQPEEPQGYDDIPF